MPNPGSGGTSLPGSGSGVRALYELFTTGATSDCKGGAIRSHGEAWNKRYNAAGADPKACARLLDELVQFSSSMNMQLAGSTRDRLRPRRHRLSRLEPLN